MSTNWALQTSENADLLEKNILELIEKFEKDNGAVIEGVTLTLIPVPPEEATSKRHTCYSSRHISFDIKPQ